MPIRELFTITALYYFILGFFNPPSLAGLTINVYDVGQADSILITTKNNKHILIDGGGDYQAEAKISQEFGLNDCFLDYIFITHGHADHLGGLLRILEKCKFGSLTFNDVDCESKKCQILRSEIDPKMVNNLQELTVDGVKIKVLGLPEKRYNGGLDVSNNNSIIIFLDYGDFEALFTGDAGGEILDELPVNELLPLIQGKLDVFKVSHHGSRTGLPDKFFGSITPKECAISVGKGNSYGHPHAEALEYFNDLGCIIRRTDLEGDVKFVVK